MAAVSALEGVLISFSLDDDVSTTFLTLLSQWDNEEVDRKLVQRVEFSRRAITKLVQAFDRLTQRNETISKLINELGGRKEGNSTKAEPMDGK